MKAFLRPMRKKRITIAAASPAPTLNSAKLEKVRDVRGELPQDMDSTVDCMRC